MKKIKEIRKHYKWFLEHCKRFKKDTIPYKQFKKEFIETCELNQTPEEQIRLNNLKKIMDKVKLKQLKGGKK